jgi:2-(3-amino-3-carboxypropyl)histidine synthase
MESLEQSSIYDLEIDRVIEEVKSRKSKRVLLQFPDGLIKYCVRIAKRIKEQTRAETIISLDTCYGACDLAVNAASRLNADLLIHYGHGPWPAKTSVPTIYVEAFATLDVRTMLPKIVELLGDSRRIGVLSTIQHIRELPKVREYLESRGLKVVVGKATGKVSCDGQILGCDYSTAKSISSRVERLVLIGGGKFHAIGLALATRKDSVVIDLFSNEVYTTGELLRRVLRSRYASVMAARSATVFGVVLGTKFGQFDLQRADGVRRELERQGKETILLCVDNLIPDRLESLAEVDAFVITACPRIAIDEAEHFKRPVLTPEEVQLVFSDELLERYLSLG